LELPQTASFTSAALCWSMKGKMKWDDKVINTFPEFKMYNDYLTNEFTIRTYPTHKQTRTLAPVILLIWPGRATLNLKILFFGPKTQHAALGLKHRKL
jgi:hypothetical protein